MYVSAVVLPDSTVFETGGAAKSTVYAGAPVQSAQIFNPEDERRGPRSRRPPCRGCTTPRQCCCPMVESQRSGATRRRRSRCASRFSPRRTSKPEPPDRRSPAAPNEFRYGDYAAFATTQAAPITSAVLVSPAATTHSSDPNQRLVDLAFSQTSTGVSRHDAHRAQPGTAGLVHDVRRRRERSAVGRQVGSPRRQQSARRPVDTNSTASAACIRSRCAAAPSAPAVNRGPVLVGLGHCAGGGAAAEQEERLRARRVRRDPPVRLGNDCAPAGGDGYSRTGTVGTSRGDRHGCPNGSGGYVLDGFGGIHRFRVGSGALPPAIVGAPYWTWSRPRPGDHRFLPTGRAVTSRIQTDRLYPFRIGSGGLIAPAVARPYVPGPARPRRCAPTERRGGSRARRLRWVARVLGGRRSTAGRDRSAVVAGLAHRPQRHDLTRSGDRCRRATATSRHAVRNGETKSGLAHAM